MAWNPDQYLKFAQPRLRPAIDLLARIALASPRRIADLGCGTGNITRLLAQRWPEAEVTGVDSAVTMLTHDVSGLSAPEAGRIRWQQADLAQWQAEAPPDLIYSNAALHWLPQHERLLPRLLAMLAPGGVLAVQMPRNFGAPSHTAIAETVHEGPWRDKLLPLLKPTPVAEPAWYYTLLAAVAAEVDLWETEYLQVLTGPNPVKEWTKGTWLAQFLAALEGDEAAAFEEAYAAKMRAAYPMRADGRTLFPFKRLFMIVRR
ncbi:methyltransferase domain-containing protein [Aquabacterium sp.]|uniref:methyltransferase domain-containing protein n=1 Tax=Aquabacterium sp. TaxID=1872578 RepID=UPI00378401E5